MMNKWSQFIQNISDRRLFLLAILLAIPAFLYNLGLSAFIGDEAIRTLVALEMKWSGNYLVPTLNGVLYFNKPPMFNWFILFASECWGSFGEWPTRLTSLFFLLCYAVTLFYFGRKHFNFLTSACMVLMLLSSGRILFWDSIYGLIDICFSWIVFLNFMILYHYSEKERWQSFFTISYVLCSIAFLLKGLPAIVFQGISILVTLHLKGVLRNKLFSLNHFLGASIGLAPLVIYYILYAKQVSLNLAFNTLFDQSLQRTVTHFGIKDTIIHLFTFPFEQIYHFLPWSILIVLIFHPKFWNTINSNRFIRFNFWILLANIPVYWTSVQVYPRYLLMFLPLFNIILFFVLNTLHQNDNPWYKLIYRIFISTVFPAFIICLVMPLNDKIITLPGIWYLWSISSLLLLIIFLAMLVDEKRIILWMSIALFSLRLVFDGVVIPIRMQTDREHFTRLDCNRLATQHGHVNWYVYDSTQIHEVARFYTTKYCNKLIPKSSEIINKDAYYLVDLNKYPQFYGIQIDSLLLETNQRISLMKINK